MGRTILFLQPTSNHGINSKPSSFPSRNPVHFINFYKSKTHLTCLANASSSIWESSVVVGTGIIPSSVHFLWWALDFICLVRFPLVLNANEQCLHLYGRRSVWVRMCFFNILGFLQRMPHSSQTYFPRPRPRTYV